MDFGREFGEADTQRAAEIEDSLPERVVDAHAHPWRIADLPCLWKTPSALFRLTLRRSLCIASAFGSNSDHVCQRGNDVTIQDNLHVLTSHALESGQA